MDKEEEEEEEDNDDDDDVIFTIANFFEKFCPFFGEIFCTVEKSHVFLRKILQKNIQCKNYRKNLRKNLRKNKRKTSQIPYSLNL